MTVEVHVIVEITKEVSVGVCNDLAVVANELPFRHLVLDVRAVQVDAEEE